MKVLIERFARQIKWALKYAGFITLGGIKFDYTIELKIPLYEIDGISMSRKKFRSIFCLNLAKNGKKIKLTHQESFLFIRALMSDFLPRIYNNKSMRGGNDKTDEVLDGLACMDFYELPAEVCSVLSSPKFGCPLNIKR
jgi:hypothetical protein